MNFAIKAIDPNAAAGNGQFNADAGLQKQQSSGQILQDFAKMLIVQITNQDPNNPMDPTAIIAQFAQVQASMGIAKLTEQNDYWNKINLAMNAVGKRVIMRDPAKSNVAYIGTVTGIDYSGRTPAFRMNGSTYTFLDGQQPVVQPMTDTDLIPLEWMDQVEDQPTAGTAAAAQGLGTQALSRGQMPDLSGLTGEQLQALLGGGQ